jgi:hypothetical protein
MSIPEFRQKQQIEHYNKYLVHIKRLGISFDNSDKKINIVHAIKQGDIHLNTIPLWQWDMYHFWYKNASKDIPTWAIVETVCTAKLAALISGIKFILGSDIDLSTGENIFNALQRIQNDYKNGK